MYIYLFYFTAKVRVTKVFRGNDIIALVGCKLPRVSANGVACTSW